MSRAGGGERTGVGVVSRWIGKERGRRKKEKLLRKPVDGFGEGEAGWKNEKLKTAAAVVDDPRFDGGRATHNAIRR